MSAAQLAVDTPGRGLIEITARIHRWLAAQDPVDGVVQLFIRHTSASLIICENADPDVLRDLETWMSRAVEDGDPRFVHRLEGPDDMAAHIRSVITASHLSLPVSNGELALGIWQGVFLWEHRYRAQRRSLELRLLACA